MKLQEKRVQSKWSNFVSVCVVERNKDISFNSYTYILIWLYNVEQQITLTFF